MVARPVATTSRSVELSRCTTAHPRYIRFTERIVASFSETAMRPNPAPGADRVREGHAGRHGEGRAVHRGGQGTALTHDAHHSCRVCHSGEVLTVHRGGQVEEGERVAEEGQRQGRAISDCHFRKTSTEYDRKPGIKWLSCTEK
jgi:hypothetical protein